jgi:hypothetical protein
MSVPATKKTRFARRVPDHVTDELVNVLASEETMDFSEIFELVYANLKLKNAVSGGEEMLRLRTYEKLLSLVNRNLCVKSGKTYKGLPELKNQKMTVTSNRASGASAAAC